MCIICTGEYKNIECKDLVLNCPNLTSIPNIEGLNELWCKNCPSLTNISHIEGLKELWCWDCPSLTNIPHIEGLNGLWCKNCPSLTDISYIPKINELKELYCKGCPWLNHPANINFQKNIKLLKRLQKWVHNNLLSKKITKYLESEQFNNWYYSPNEQGGKRIIEKLEKLKYIL